MPRSDSPPTEPALLGRVRALGAWCLGLPRGFWAAVALVWMGLIWFLSSHSGGMGSGLFVMEWLSNLAHAPLFGLLALWIALAGPRVESGGAPVWSRPVRRDRLLVLLFVMVWAISDELHQSWVPGRDASVLDLVTDGVAAWAVLMVARAASPLERGREAQLGRTLGFGFGACLLAALAASL